MFSSSMSFLRRLSPPANSSTRRFASTTPITLSKFPFETCIKDWAIGIGSQTPLASIRM